MPILGHSSPNSCQYFRKEICKDFFLSLCLFLKASVQSGILIKIG